MQFSIHCDCGKEHSVTEGTAGQTLHCSCGRSVPVPTYRQLCVRAGREPPRLDPASALEQLLLAGRAPRSNTCVSCGVAVDRDLMVQIEVERAVVVQTEPSVFVYALLWLVSHLGAIVIRAMHKGYVPAEFGKDRRYQVPLSICSACRQRLTGPVAIKGALRLVPLYRDVLLAYPEARVRVPTEG